MLSAKSERKQEPGNRGVKRELGRAWCWKQQAAKKRGEEGKRKRNRKQSRRMKFRETGTELKAWKQESGEAGRDAGEVHSRAGAKANEV